MSLTQEDLKAISDLIDIKLDKQEQNINNLFDEIYNKIQQNDKGILTEAEKRLYNEIREVKDATIQNCYDIACLKQKIK